MAACMTPWQTPAQHAWKHAQQHRSEWRHGGSSNSIAAWQHGSDDVNIQEVVLSSQFQLPIWKPPSSHPPHCAVSIHLHVIASEILSPLSAVHGELATKLFSLLKESSKDQRPFNFTFPNRVLLGSTEMAGSHTRISTWSCWEATQSPAACWMHMVDSWKESLGVTGSPPCGAVILALPVTK